MMEIRSKSEYKSFLNKNEKLLLKIQKISMFDIEYSYVFNQNEIVYYDYNTQNGWVKDYKIAREEFEKKNIDLRTIISEQIGREEFTRSNYLEFGASILDSLVLNQNRYLNIVKAISDNNLEISELLKDKNLNYISNKLDNFPKERLLDIEIPLLGLFVSYGVNTYNNIPKISPRNNMFKEEYFGIILDNDSKFKIDLSDILFRVLFPDFERDDFDLEKNVKIDLSIVKWYIDSNNRSKK